MFIKRTLISTALLAATAMQAQAGNGDSGFLADSHVKCEPPHLLF